MRAVAALCLIKFIALKLWISRLILLLCGHTGWVARGMARGF
jgi:hypothetical protein